MMLIMNAWNLKYTSHLVLQQPNEMGFIEAVVKMENLRRREFKCMVSYIHRVDGKAEMWT